MPPNLLFNQWFRNFRNGHICVCVCECVCDVQRFRFPVKTTTLEIVHKIYDPVTGDGILKVREIASTVDVLE